MQKNISNNLTAVTIGDIKGIGIQILIKVWKSKEIRDFVLITNYELFNRYILKNKISIKIFRSSIVNNQITYQKDSFNILNIKESKFDCKFLSKYKLGFIFLNSNSLISHPLTKNS